MLFANDNWSVIIIIREFSVIQIQSYCFLSDKTTFLSRIQINIRQTYSARCIICVRIVRSGR